MVNSQRIALSNIIYGWPIILLHLLTRNYFPQVQCSFKFVPLQLQVNNLEGSGGYGDDYNDEDDAGSGIYVSHSDGGNKKDSRDRDEFGEERSNGGGGRDRVRAGYQGLN